MTIEVTIPPLVSQRETRHEIYIRVKADFERIDSSTLNATVDDKDCDLLTDYLDLKNYPWRIV